VNRVAGALRKIRDIGTRYGVPIVTYGHIGDGNLHAAPIIDPNEPTEIEKVKKIADEIHHMALDLDGTTTGEHGVGLARAEYMEEELGLSLHVMRRIKRLLDPRNILNPGKMSLDDQPPESEREKIFGS
jgi:glycolate oxidase